MTYQGDKPLTAIGRAAVDYARRGWHVAPVHAGTKGQDEQGRSTHYLRNGHNGASADPDQVRRWWTQWPDANIVLNLAASGLVALDPDTYKPECEWHQFIRGRELPDTLVQRSARGGRHYIFTAPADARFQGKLCEGVEIKHKGYIVLEPSTFEGGQYEFITSTPPAPAPAWVPRAGKFSEQAKATGPRVEFTLDTDGEADIEVVRKLLREAPNDFDRRDWVKIASALKYTFGDAIREDFLAWSARYSGKVNPEADARMWETLEPSGDAKLGSAIFMLRGPSPKPNIGGGGKGTDGGSGRGASTGKSAPLADLTEDGVALHFTGKFAGKLRFDHDRGQWFEWKGGRWKPDGTHLAYSFCRQIARELSEGLPDKDRKTVRKAAFAAGVERMARADRAHAVTSEAWDADPYLLGCPGVTVDLRTGQHLAPDPVNGITRQAAVAPAKGAPVLWLAFLHEVCEGDPEMVRFLQQWCGYCLTGDTREHALLFVYGPGGNGKSVFLETVAHILADYATTSSMDTFTASKSDRHPTDLAMLRGARLVSASETEEGRAWAESRIKQLTGGDQITARFMRQDFFTYLPQFKLTVVGNHKPVLRNVDDAARRRFNIVPFTVKPRTPDPELVAKLKAEAPAILQWMIEGSLDWQRNGLVRPRRVLEATAEYFDDQDLFGQWLEEACRIEPENRHLAATPKELFEAWSAYAHAAGEQPGTQTAMGNALTKRGLAKDVRKISGKTSRLWRGIALNQPENWCDFGD